MLIYTLWAAVHGVCWARLLCWAHHLHLDLSLCAGTAWCCWCTIPRRVVSLVSRSVVTGSDVHQPVPRNLLSGAMLCAPLGIASVSVTHMLYSLGILLPGGVSVCTHCAQPLLFLPLACVSCGVRGSPARAVCPPLRAGLSSPWHTQGHLAVCRQGILSQCHQSACVWFCTSGPHIVCWALFGVISRHACSCRGARALPCAASLHHTARVCVMPFPLRSVSLFACVAPAHQQRPAGLPRGGRFPPPGQRPAPGSGGAAQGAMGGRPPRRGAQTVAQLPSATREEAARPFPLPARPGPFSLGRRPSPRRL